MKSVLLWSAAVVILCVLRWSGLYWAFISGQSQENGAPLNCLGRMRAWTLEPFASGT